MLPKLLPTNIQGLYAQLAKGGHSRHVRHRVHKVLHRALAHAMESGIVSRNACDMVERPTVPRTEMKYLTIEQAGQLLEFAKTERLYALYVLATTSGLRQGELFGLRWEDIDMDAQYLSVRRALRSCGGKSEIAEPKSARGRRRVELPQIAIDALRMHRKSMFQEGKRTADFVFCDTDGGPLRPSNVVRRSFKPLLKRAGLPDIRFHDLRHTAATMLLTQGVHAKVVQERLGHANISLTLDTYSHVIPSLQRDAADRIDRLFPARSLAKK